MASEKSARREPCLMFERNHFIPKGALRQRTEVPRRYNITSQGLLEPVNRSPSACSEISQDVCDSRNATRASKDPRPLRGLPQCNNYGLAVLTRSRHRRARVAFLE